MDLNTGQQLSRQETHRRQKNSHLCHLHRLGSVYMLTCPFTQGQARRWPASQGPWAVAAWRAEQASLPLPGPASVELSFPSPWS